MPLDKFGRHFHHSSRRARYNILKAKGVLYSYVSLNIPCVNSSSRYVFPLESATILSAVKISKDVSEVQLFVNDLRVYSLDALKHMVLKHGDRLDFSHNSEEILYVQLVLKSPVIVE